MILGAAFAIVLAEPRAAYVSPEELAPNGVHHLLDIATVGELGAVTERGHGIRDFGAADLRARFYVGRHVSWCFGADGRVGASDAGTVYGATGYLVGLGARWGAGNVISLCGGAGIDQMGRALKSSATLPVELRASLSLGPIRPTIWLKPSWLGRVARREGATPSFVDELDAGLLVRLARQHRYWSEVSAGGGLALGVTYREFLGVSAVGLMVGFDFAGEQ